MLLIRGNQGSACWLKKMLLIIISGKSQGSKQSFSINVYFIIHCWYLEASYFFLIETLCNPFFCLKFLKNIFHYFYWEAILICRAAMLVFYNNRKSLPKKMNSLPKGEFNFWESQHGSIQGLSDLCYSITTDNCIPKFPNQFSPYSNKHAPVTKSNGL